MTTSAVVRSEATPAASCRARRTTLAGSMIPGEGGGGREREGGEIGHWFLSCNRLLDATAFAASVRLLDHVQSDCGYIKCS